VFSLVVRTTDFIVQGDVAGCRVSARRKLPGPDTSASAIEIFYRFIIAIKLLSAVVKFSCYATVAQRRISEDSISLLFPTGLEFDRLECPQPCHKTDSSGRKKSIH
jgi:hypothetical protein